MQVSNPVTGSPSTFVPVFYQVSAIAEKDEVSCHGKAKQNCKSYFRTSKDVLQKAREKCLNGLDAKTVYDEMKRESD